MGAGLPDGPFALLHPGVSRFGAYKQWPTEKYVELAQKLQSKGLSVVVSAGPGEEELGNSITQQAGAKLLSGLSLPALVEAIRQATVFVGSDTGPTQISWLLGTPTVALMGPKDERVYGPLGSSHRKLAAGVECRPCGKRSCDDPRCITAITVHDVLEAAISALGQG
jgi:ADP-heptose:LPS heptosyltransferase